MKSYLNQIYKINEQIKDKEERLEDLRESMTAISGIDYGEDKVQSSSSSDASFTRITDAVIDLENEIKSDMLDLLHTKIELNKLIEQLDNVNQRLVLSKRCLLLKSWDVIAEEMHYSVRHVQRIYNESVASCRFLSM